MYISVSHVCSAHKGQKRLLDSLELELHTEGCKPPCWCWELDLGPLQKQEVFLTVALFIQPQFLMYFYFFLIPVFLEVTSYHVFI